MIRLAMLLVGARVLRRKWRALVVLGTLWIALGLAIMVDASNGLDVVAVETLAILLLFEGFLALALFTLAPHRRGYTVADQVAGPSGAGLHDPGLSRPGRHRGQPSVRARLPDRRRHAHRHGEPRALPQVARWSPSAARSSSASARSSFPTGRSATTRPCRSASAWRCCCPAGPSSGSGLRLRQPERRHAGGQPARLRASRLARRRHGAAARAADRAGAPRDAADRPRLDPGRIGGKPARPRIGC